MQRNTDEEPMLEPVLKALSHASRCSILWLLMGDRPMTPSEISRRLKLARSTTSHHLDALERAQLVTSDWSKGHRFSRLAGEQVAQLVERLALFSRPTPEPDNRPIAKASRCYQHLGGRLSVQIATALIERRLIDTEGAPYVTPSGIEWLRLNGWWSASAPPTVALCLDWTERRPHFAGELGTTLLSRFLRQGWLRARPDSRVLTVTVAGRIGFEDEWAFDLKQPNGRFRTASQSSGGQHRLNRTGPTVW